MFIGLLGLCLNVLAVITIGEASQIFLGKRERQYGESVIYGTFCVMAMFQIICIPCIYLQIAFSLMRRVFHISVLVSGVISYIYIVKRERVIGQYRGEFIKEALCNWNIWKVVGIGVIVFQIVIVTVYSHTDADDASFVAIINTTLQSDTMLKYSSYTGEMDTPLVGVFKRALSPFQMFQAVMSADLNIHPAVLCHVFFPFLGTIFMYMIYYKLGKFLFFDRHNNCVWKFLVVVSLLNLYGNYSILTTSSMALLRIWQGKAFFAAVIIPALLFCILIFLQDCSKRNRLMCFIVICAGTLTSNIAFVATPIFIFSFLIIKVIEEKEIWWIFQGLLMCISCWILGIIELICAVLYGVI